MAKIFYIIITAFFLIFVQTKSIYINVNTGSDTTGDGTQGNPYKTINFGISKAITGDSLQISEGSYYENIIMDKVVYLNGSATNTPSVFGSVTLASNVTNWYGQILSNLNFYNTSYMLIVSSGLTFNGVVFYKVGFFLNGDISTYNAIFNFKGSVALIQSGLTWQNCTFYTGTYKNPAGALFSIRATGGPMIFDGILVEGYSPEGMSAQINLCCDFDTVTVRNSRSHGGGNFYICRVSGVSIYNNIFDGGPIGISGCDSVTIENNLFNNTGDFPVYGPNPDPYPGHTGGVGILGVDGADPQVSDITIQNNLFVGRIRSASVMVNRWKEAPTPATFNHVSIQYNDFSQIDDFQTSLIIDCNFTEAYMDASYNYWGSYYGPTLCAANTSCPYNPSSPSPLRVRGNVNLGSWYCDSTMQKVTTDGSNCAENPQPETSASDDHSLAVGLGVGIPLGVALIFVAIFAVYKKRRADNLRKQIFTSYQTGEWTSVLNN
ncbi:hypothetical protein M0811_02090 [Anaeramoeba ignava]|uniref:DUF1565 domain-containing protein n=1 Tax=Anaeramoeba ignava TaxID=1746090 RepID=A0A9Q0LBQ6_ANAIG|nr:hypothetical protein M0811_02090 [Anaeramoeba ignava]|eukprot:Anaeramoba_ignava/a43_386.p1 GENE.a43_386~~a43_386.p1  ORF type:complete len:491 (+),score=108.96 a43_386:37-1509(+)